MYYVTAFVGGWLDEFTVCRGKHEIAVNVIHESSDQITVHLLEWVRVCCSAKRRDA